MFDLAVSPYSFQPRRSFPESSGAGRGFFIGPPYAKKAYVEGGDGGRESLDVGVELEEHEVVPQGKDDDASEGLCDLVPELGRSFELWDFDASVEGVDVAVVSAGDLSLGEAALTVVGGEGAKMAEMDFALRKNGTLCEEIGIEDDDSMAGSDRSSVDETCDPPRSLPSLLTTVLR